MKQSTVNWARGIGLAIVVVAMLLTGHWFLHPMEAHPPAWLLALFFLAGIAIAFPEALERLANVFPYIRKGGK